MVFSTATNENSPSSTATSTRPSVLRTRTNLVNSPIMKLKRKNSDEQLLPPSKRSSTTTLSETTKNPNATLGLTDTFNNKENKNDEKEVRESSLVEKQQQQIKESESKKQIIDEKTRRELEKQEIEELKKNLPFLCEYYDIMEKIGRGTFSTVYKALDIRRDLYDNEEWLSKMLSKPYTGEDKAQHLNDMKNLSEFVALKRVYSTSSPQRISNEIHILQELKGTSCISPLITAFRDGDDTFVVMPYIQNDDFNDLYNTMSLLDIKSYLKSLFTALSQLHRLKIIHKDVKPNNFLYNAKKRVGYLIDFGLAQREEETKHYEEKPVAIDDVPLIEPVKGFDTKDPRKQVRANRAGTRGYRAPEVLLRVVHQTTAVDIWSAGIIFLSLLTKVFPFFVGYDEADSIVEIANIFGIQELQKMALKYNRVIHTNIPGLPKQKISLKKLCAYYNGDKLKEWPEKDIRNAMNLLESCLQLDPVTRITAQDALNHPFLHFD